ncbi:hypothetical protein PHISP_01506 [Aspergillus sp. HF37]|nr:hypothetical protein PHISP_01506 [Aspergillus sp. HF37]
MALYANISYPKWTYDGLAFPILTFPPNITNLPARDGYTVTVNTEAVRINATVSALLCSPYFETDETNLTLSPKDSTSLPAFFKGTPVKEKYPYPVDFDELFTVIVAGRGGTPAPKLVGADNIPHLKKAVQHTFGIIEA